KDPAPVSLQPVSTTTRMLGQVPRQVKARSRFRLHYRNLENRAVQAVAGPEAWGASRLRWNRIGLLRLVSAGTPLRKPGVRHRDHSEADHRVRGGHNANRWVIVRRVAIKLRGSTDVGVVLAGR